mmetsp:Transcript_2213/g.6583  ORF Transcript_2213/g.6583 Transcript_2213/m.6583 type:complete len:434 (-) Transcript_2213:121-1422(-)
MNVLSHGCSLTRRLSPIEAVRNRRQYTSKILDITKQEDFLGLSPPPDPQTFPPNHGRDFFKFEVVHRSKTSLARAGVIHTPHGIVETPGFVAVGTNAALKAVDHRIADDCGQQLMFCNTYHLLLQPGPEIIANAGGIHNFMNRNKPIITDSGGFQVFSLSQGSVSDELNMKARGPHRSNEGSLLDEISEKGAKFRSYRDGKQHLLTPESSVEAQKAYGSDIIVPLDELPPYHIERKRLEESVYLTHRWEARSLHTHLKDIRKQAMYGVIHGGVDQELRQLSIDYICSLPFDGFGIGGSLGKDRDELIQLLEFVMPRLDKRRPNHLLGIADVDSIARAVPLGVDTFDSCFPTRMGRHGTILTRKGPLKARKSSNRNVYSPPDPEWGLQNVSLAYMHYLSRQNVEMAGSLITLHNIKFMCDFMADLRNKIKRDEI